MNSMSTVSANMCLHIEREFTKKLREKMEVLTPKGVYWELLGMHLEEEQFGKNAGRIFCG